MILVCIIYWNIWPDSDIAKLVESMTYAAGRWNAGERTDGSKTWDDHIMVYHERNLETSEILTHTLVRGGHLSSQHYLMRDVKGDTIMRIQPITQGPQV